MSWIIKKKKKELSDEQKVKRGMFMLALLAAGFLYIVLTKPDNTVTFDKPKDSSETAMDKTVDSLLAEKFPDGYTVLDIGEMENSYSEIHCNQELELHKVNYEIENYEKIFGVSKGKYRKETKEKLDSLYDLKRILEIQVEDFKNHSSAKVDKKARRLKVATPDGKIWTGFQELMLNISAINYLVEITDIKDAVTELQLLASKDSGALREKLLNNQNH